MTIYISGINGFVGKALAKSLEDPLPIKREGFHFSFEGKPDVIIHLAGKNIAESRWSDATKREIKESRVVGTQNLVHDLIERDLIPKVFISASAVGIYGDRGDEELSELSAPGEGFLPTVCKRWEEVSYPLKDLGVRVCHARFGAVLDPSGGMLKKILPIFKLGLGGSLGSGAQWMSFIMLEDLVRALKHIIETDSLSGPINMCAPNPVTNKEFTKALAKSLHRWVGPKVPACILKFFFQDLAENLLLSSQRAFPNKLIESNFQFKAPTIDTVLNHFFS